MLLGDLFDLSLRGRAGAVGLICDGPDGRRELTFGEIADRADRLAAVLHRRGLQPGDRVAVYLANRLAFVDLFLACVRSGLVLVPINVLYRDREIAHIVADADPALIVTAAAQFGLFPAGSRLADVEELRQEAAAATDRVPRPAIDGDAPAGIIYTSGTTGRSKGAVLTHHNFAANATSLLACWRITSADRYLAVLPLFHVHGLGNGLCCWLASGCTMRLVERFEIGKALDWFRDFEPTLFFGVPTVYVRLLELPEAEARAIGDRARLFVSGSAPLPPAVLEQFREQFGHTILERYGMSETLMLTSNLLEGDRRAGTVGWPLPGTSVTVRDRQGGAVTTGNAGEVWVKGPTVFPGYWRNAEATARAFSDGWFRTGDVGELDATGCLALRGRATELIISGGFNIYPREIEEVLLEQPGVREAAVVGAPDPRRGEVPVAYVVTDDGVDCEALRERCAASLASFKAPRAVIRLDALPRNAMGKLQKHLLLLLLWIGLAAPAGAADLRVMSYNIKHGQTNAACTSPATTLGQPPAADCNLDLQAAIAVIRTHEPDVVGLQEVDRFWARSGYQDEPAVLAEATGLKHSCYAPNLAHPPDAHADRPHQYGTLILSRHPIASCNNTLLPRAGAASEQRGFTLAAIDVQGVTVRFYNTHLHTAPADRLLQTDAIVKAIDRAAPEPMVILGDFNARPAATELAPILARLTDAWTAAGARTADNQDGLTSPAEPGVPPRNRIDYVFVSAAVRVRAARVVVDDATRLASDHYPVVVDLTVPDAEPAPTLVTAWKIWGAGAHNAFTDLIRWRDRWFCTFREGDAHVGGDGRVRVLTSTDGEAWTSAALIAEPGVDLRDPKFSIAPDGRLMIVAGGSVYDGTTYRGRQPRVLFSSDGRAWSPPERILAEGDWLWRVIWHDGTAYGVTYRTATAEGAEWTATLVSSRDGRTFQEIATFAIPGRPNETTLRVMPDGEMVALVRREAGDRFAWVGRSRAPYSSWTWRDTAHFVGGPNFIRLPDGELWASGRSVAGSPKTVVARLALDGRYEPALTLPSGGDTSYAGMVWHDGLLWVSYYASHEGTSAIYLARVKPPR